MPAASCSRARQGWLAARHFAMALHIGSGKGTPRRGQWPVPSRGTFGSSTGRTNASKANRYTSAPFCPPAGSFRVLGQFRKARRIPGRPQGPGVDPRPCSSGQRSIGRSASPAQRASPKRHVPAPECETSIRRLNILVHSLYLLKPRSSTIPIHAPNRPTASA